MPDRGAIVDDDGVRFSAWSGMAERMWLCLFDDTGAETARLEMARDADGVFSLLVQGVGPGQRYGLCADGPYDPAKGLWFDPAKLLMDPYALEIDRPWRYDPRLAAPRDASVDTAPLVPKAIVKDLGQPLPPQPPLFRPGGVIYEASVRALTMRHPDIPTRLRGTVSALAHPAIVDHLTKLGVSAIELMPVTAWIDERHLPPLGLTNAWGYNPVSFMALDPRLAPGGVAELRATVAALRAAGIGVILDLVFNHTGESDALGPTLSLRGLDNRAYYRHLPGEPATLANDTGCGNTVATRHPEIRRLILDTLRHFVVNCGVDGFRFDLAPVLGRDHAGFDPAAGFFADIAADPLLAGRVLIAEPWDIGPGGYHLGNFPKSFLEWNDRFRDDVRRFWRGDEGTLGALATRLAGSSDVFGGDATRSVNFIAAHDGMSLADMVAYEEKHNLANGEDNRDGHDENLSWNNGVEGDSDDPDVIAARGRDLRALLATLFLSRGTVMLTAGDEFGRTQKGNNNAYAQDNELTWLDWQGRDRGLEAFVAALGALRRAVPPLGETGFFTGADEGDGPDIAWLDARGNPLSNDDWNGSRRLSMVVRADGDPVRVALMINGDRRRTVFTLPASAGHAWTQWPGTEMAGVSLLPEGGVDLGGRTVAVMVERAMAQNEGAGGA